MKQKFIYLIVIIAAVIVAAVLLYPKLSGLRFRKDTLLSCSVTTGGGMLGGRSSITLKRDAEGNPILVVTSRPTHADREKTVTYPAGEEGFQVIRDLAVKHDLYAASKRPYSKIQVLDGDTTSLRFHFEKDYFSISEQQVMNRSMRNGFDEVIQYLTSMERGEGIETLEPQTAMLYLKSGYTLQFTVVDAFDGKLDAILQEEYEVSRFETSGILLHEPVSLDTEHAESMTAVTRGTAVYDPDSGCIILLYADHTFDHPVFPLMILNGYPDSACPLIEEMEGPYRLYLN